ncbi:MAG: hypothetical protein KDD64_11010 [Bdellovibrionales bacterium]|nr:hypothetical protein [Bdellovibrionales bacterium]
MSYFFGQTHPCSKALALVMCSFFVMVLTAVAVLADSLVVQDGALAFESDGGFLSSSQSLVSVEYRARGKKKGSKGKKGKKKGKKKKGSKQTVKSVGIYTGTFSLAKSQSFNGANCTPTSSFLATLAISGVPKRPKGQLGNIPIEFSGTADSQGVKLNGTFVDGSISRKYVISLRKVKATSASLTLSETVKVGKLKACVFKHAGDFSRS